MGAINHSRDLSDYSKHFHHCTDHSQDSSVLQGEACGVWQHCQCVGIDCSATPEHYFCQRCRVALADPFWQADSIPLFTAAKLESVPGRPVVVRPSGKEETKLADRAFRLSHPQLEPLRRNSQTEQLHVRLLGKASIIVWKPTCPTNINRNSRIHPQHHMANPVCHASLS